LQRHAARLPQIAARLTEAIRSLSAELRARRGTAPFQSR
jgi:hypothetical protein